MKVYPSAGHRNMLSTEECLGWPRDWDLDVIFIIHETFERKKINKVEYGRKDHWAIIGGRERV